LYAEGRKEVAAIQLLPEGASLELSDAKSKAQIQLRIADHKPQFRLLDESGKVVYSKP
jgi:hypothetical protein